MQREVHLGYSPPQAALQLLPQAYTADNPQDCCCFPPARACTLPHSIMCRDSSPELGGNQQPSANPTFLSMYCMLVNAGLDFPSQGATCKAENPTLPREQPHLEARLPSARHRGCPYTVHSSKNTWKTRLEVSLFQLTEYEIHA